MIQIINLPKILDQRGNLSFVEELKHIPFEIKRSYWIYDVPGGAERGGHAYRKNDEFMIALSGSFDVVLNDGKEEKIYHLNRSFLLAFFRCISGVLLHYYRFTSDTPSLYLLLGWKIKIE